MEQVKKQLSRKVGPFTVGAWLIVAIVGIGLGLAVKRALGGGAGVVTPGASGESMPSNPNAFDGLLGTQGIAPGNIHDQQSDFATTAALNRVYSRFDDEVNQRFQDFVSDFFTGQGPGEYPWNNPDDPGEGDSPINQDGDQPISDSDTNAGGNVPVNYSTLEYTARSGDTWEDVARAFIAQLGQGSEHIPIATVVSIIRSQNANSSGTPTPGVTYTVAVQG